MCRMNVSASIQKASTPPGSSTHSARSTSRSKRTWSVWVGVKAVKSWLPGSAAAQSSSSVAVERPRPPQRPPALERARLLAGEHAIAVGARLRRRAGRRSPPARARSASTLTSSGSSPFSRAASTGSPGVAGHLPAGVHAAVGATRHGQPQRPAGDRLERVLEHSLHGAQARLPRPAGELRAVVLEQEPRGQRYPRLRATIWRYSPSMRTGAVAAVAAAHDLQVLAVHRLELLGRQRFARRHLQSGRRARARPRTPPATRPPRSTERRSTSIRAARPSRRSRAVSSSPHSSPPAGLRAAGSSACPRRRARR